MTKQGIRELPIVFSLVYPYWPLDNHNEFKNVQLYFVYILILGVKLSKMRKSLHRRVKKLNILKINIERKRYKLFDLKLKLSSQFRAYS